MARESDPVLEALQGVPGTHLHPGHSLAEECSYRIGGPARYFARPETVGALRDLWQAAKKLDVPVFILGGGSNVLFQDQGFPGLILSLRKLDSLAPLAGNLFRVGAGVHNSVLTAHALEHALTGFEWASGLPGTVGGGIYMNAKCYGRSFSEMVESVSALTSDGEIKTLSQAECGFAYKQSVFQSRAWIITEASLRLAPGEISSIRQATQANQEDRVRKGHFAHPSAGCVFKNDYSVCIPSGRLIEECGLKGLRIGDAQIFEQHANFIVNRGQARARDVLALMDKIRRTVWEKKRVKLEEEIRVVPD